MLSPSPRTVIAAILSLAAVVSVAWAGDGTRTDGYVGSRTCKACHERFYGLWSTSFHGLAMQPYRRELAAAKLGPQDAAISIGRYRYRADLSGTEGWIDEEGPEGKKRYRIDHVLGGKNVFYFLTSLAGGRLQTLPLGYDVRTRQWFDMAASGMRHFPDRGPDAAVAWKDWPYTFNTACFGCHVSQLSTNYDPKSDTYRTVWLEAGINCETCHGPSERHVRLFEGMPKEAPAPADPEIISIKRFTAAQRNDSCSSCHAKASPLTESYPPGERFFDHFDLVTLESSDYFPDGRDLGENYTATTWRMSRCVESGDLDCVNCHTSSGRYRFRDEEKANEACLPCHKDRVADPAPHTHHAKDGPGSRCVACHMPMTDFARMRRSDHSMRPPSPAATIRFKSPNACNGCHADKTPQWADQEVRRWSPRDYQAPVLRRGELIAAARARDWRRLPEMLAAVTGKDRDEIVANSLVRLLRACDDERIAPALLAALKDPSPLVRASAAESLGSSPSAAAVRALVGATGDDFRLVRIRAAQSLTHLSGAKPGADRAASVARATQEYLASMRVRPDQWTSHYNLGNYHLSRGDYAAAVASYRTALRLEPGEATTRVNLSIAYARQGNNDGAKAALEEALSLEPENAEAHLNLGLLEAELRDPAQAEAHLRRALEADPQMAVAAYNLCVLLGGKPSRESLDFCRRAAALRPGEPRYGWAYAFYLRASGDGAAAAATLEELLRRRPGFADGVLLLADILAERGDRAGARAACDRALGGGALSPDDRKRVETARLALEAGETRPAK